MHLHHLILAVSAQIGSIATAAGVGGGAFFVPLFNILLNFSKCHTLCSMERHQFRHVKASNWAGQCGSLGQDWLITYQ